MSESTEVQTCVACLDKASSLPESLDKTVVHVSK